MAYRDDTNELKGTSAIAELERRVSALEKRKEIIQQPIKVVKKVLISFVLIVILAATVRYSCEENGAFSNALITFIVVAFLLTIAIAFDKE